MNYTQEQVEEIKAREKHALDFLKSLELTPSAVVQKINIGNDVFADRVIPFLQDTRYTPKKNEPTQTPSAPVAA